MFDREVVVPKEYIASEQGLREKCHKIKGNAGPKRMRILAENRKDKQKKASKIEFLEMKERGSGLSSAGQPEPASAQDSTA